MSIRCLAQPEEISVRDDDDHSDQSDLAIKRAVRDRFGNDVAAWDGSVTRGVMQHIRAERSPWRARGLTVGGRLAGVVVLAVVAGLVIATQLPRPPGPVSPIGAGTSPVGTRTPRVSGPPSPTLTAAPAGSPSSPAPTASSRRTMATAPAPVIRAGEFGRLLLSVPVFAQPDASQEPIQVLDRGRDLWAPQDAQVVDGSLWYRVQFIRLLGVGEYMFGWLPGVWDGQAVFRPREQECYDLRPITMAVLGMAGLTPPERRFCFGDKELQVVGTIRRVEAREPYYRVRPGWMGLAASWWLEGAMGNAAEGGAFHFHVDPASGIEVPVGDIVRITGHFDDAVSSECVVEPPPGYPELLPGESEAWCGQQLVVTAIEPAEDPWHP